MDEDTNDFMISVLMDMSMTFDPLRDFIEGEKTKLMAHGFSEEVSEKMCAATWSYLMTTLEVEIKKQGGIK